MAVVADLVTDARRLLLDDGVILRIKDAAFIAMFNEVCDRISEHHPLALIQTLQHQCSATPEQVLSSATKLVDIKHHIGGRILTQVNATDLDREDPTWKNAVASANPFHWARHQDERKFYIYPVPTTAVTVEVVAQKYHDTAQRLSAIVEYSDSYIPLIIDYLCYRSLLQDADNVENHALADSYLAKFEASLERLIVQEQSRYAV